MATNLSDDVSWLLEIGERNVDLLRPIRHWPHLAMSVVDGVVWVKGLRPEDLENGLLRSIPFARLFYLREGNLYPPGGLMPLKQLPAGLAWRPFSKSLPLRFPSFNHNYFGIGERLPVRLVASASEQPAAALLVPVDMLRRYALTASAIRFRPLQWVVLENEALVFGAPLLPLPGVVFWQLGVHLLPAGYRFEFPALAEAIGRRLCPTSGDRLFWEPDGSCLVLGDEAIIPLSTGSIRMTTTS